MAATHEHKRMRGVGHGLAMVLGCLASIAVLALVVAFGLPAWLVIAALLGCPAVLAAAALGGRAGRADGHAAAHRHQGAE